MSKRDLEIIESDLGDADTHADESDQSLSRVEKRADSVRDTDGVRQVRETRKKGREFKESIEKLKDAFKERGR